MCAWDKAKPAGNQKLRLSDEEIRANQTAAEAAHSQEHYFPNTGHDGVHKLPVGAVAPTGYEGRLAIVNNGLQWYSNGSWRGCPYPVGAIYESVSDATPSTTWPGTTWTALGAGRVLVGIDVGGDADFDTAQETGGVKTHALTVAELPAHTHITNAAKVTSNIAPGGGSGGVCTDQNLTSQATGSGQAHNNMPPYIVVYRWVRTA